MHNGRVISCGVVSPERDLSEWARGECSALVARSPFDSPETLGRFALGQRMGYPMNTKGAVQALPEKIARDLKALA